jgi:hypothetical protein
MQVRREGEGAPEPLILAGRDVTRRAWPKGRGRRGDNDSQERSRASAEWPLVVSGVEKSQ